VSGSDEAWRNPWCSRLLVHTWLNLSGRLTALRRQAPSEELGTNTAKSAHLPSPFLQTMKAKVLNDMSEKKEALVVPHHSNEASCYIFCT